MSSEHDNLQLDEISLKACAKRQGCQDGARNRKNQPPVWIKSFFFKARENLKSSYQEGYVLGKENKTEEDD